MTTTLILGGGFGGLACARALRARLPDPHRIVVVDQSPHFVVGAAKSWVMIGEREADQVIRPRGALLPAGVTWLQAEVQTLDASRREVGTTAGPLRADYLVLALGADLDPGAVPGLAEAAYSFFSLEEAVRLRRALDAFPGGRVIVLVPRAPFKCPPSPYEAAMLLHEAFVRRGLRGRTSLDVWTVEKAPMPTAGPEMGKAILGELAAREIGFHPQKKVIAVHPGRRALRFEDGAEASFDLLIAIPPHRVPRVAVEAGLADPGGWVGVDPGTLEVKRPGVAAHVYAIGDLASVPLPGRYDPARPLVLPKAGVFAAAQGEVVAERIAAVVRGVRPSAAFNGQGYCYIEVGQRRAIRGDGSFFELPHPVMSARPADQGQYRDKLGWVEGWMKPPT